MVNKLVAFRTNTVTQISNLENKFLIEGVNVFQPCWICATCKGSNTYDNNLDEQDERNLANVMSHVLNPRDLFDLSSSIQSSEHNEDSEDVDESFFPLPAPGSTYAKQIKFLINCNYFESP